MPDVFLSYHRSTVDHARDVATALRAMGYEVWLDEQLPAHRAYTDVIEEHLSAAKAVIVIWSSEAVRSEWVRSEANAGREARKLVQLSVDGVKLPLPFDQIQCADLTDWHGDLTTPGWRKVLASIAELTGTALGASGATAKVAMGSPRRVGTAATTSADGERRQLTVLCADVVGSTALSGGIDPEALRDMLRTYQAICADCVTRYGGIINQYLGDGVLAYFGYPTAHDNDAERAVLAGLALVAGVHNLEELRKARGQPCVEARVGIHTGLVVVGEMGAGDAHVNHAVGETPNLAARIQDEADPNSVCISKTTLSLLGERFHVRALGARPLKGVATHTELYSVDGAVEFKPEQRLSRQPTPLVGRELELRHLLDRWELAKRGQGQAVLLSGEGGIGKSRLLLAFREQVDAEGRAWRNFFCSPFYQNSALHPIIEMIERSIAAARTAEESDRAAVLRQVLSGAGIGDDTTYALIGSLLGLPEPPEATLSDLAPEQRKRRTFDALIAWLNADAREHPLVLVVEDLHWIDPSTRDLLGMLLERIATLPVLVVLTFRPEFVPTWATHGQISMITLQRLSSDEVVEVAHGTTAGKVLPARIVEEIVNRTDGVPLFVEELTKAIIASGLIVEHDGTLQLASGRETHLDIPATLRDSLMARLDRLGVAKFVAQLASVVGREFDYPVLRSVCDFPEAELEAQLAALNRADIIQQSGVPPRSHYVFKHALIQEAAYDSLLKTSRQQHHQTIAGAYVALFPDVVQSRPEVVAFHFSRGMTPESAIPFWQQAGELALARSGYEEATAHLNAALEQIELVPDSKERAAAELSVRVKLGPALTARMGMHAKETGENYARACDLVETLGERPERFVAMWNDWLYKNISGDVVAASRRSDDLVTLSRKLGDDEALEAHHSRWSTYFFLGDIAIVRADTLVGIHLYDPIRHRHHKHLYGGHDTGVCAHCFGGYAAWATGHTQEALRLANTAISLAREQDHSFSLALAYAANSLVSLFVLDHAAAQTAAEQLIATSEKHGFAQWLGWGMVVSGASRTAQGDTVLGLKVVDEGLKLHRATGPPPFSPMLLAFAAEAHRLVGNNAHALELLSEALDVLEKSKQRWYQPEVQRLQSEVMRQSGQISIDDAIARIERAAKLARDQGAVALEWRAVTTVAQLFARNGSPEGALARLQACVPSARDFDSRELDEVERLISTLR